MLLSTKSVTLKSMRVSDVLVEYNEALHNNYAYLNSM